MDAVVATNCNNVGACLSVVRQHDHCCAPVSAAFQGEGQALVPAEFVRRAPLVQEYHPLCSSLCHSPCRPPESHDGWLRRT